MATNVRAYTDKEILARLPICDGWTGMPQGIFDVWVRSNEDEFNRFDDKCYSFDNTSGTPKFIMVCTGTSNAGAEGLKNYQKYNRLGCAILNGNQIVYKSHGYGLHKGQYPAYRQVRPFPYYRDNDRDNKSEEIGPLYYDIIGANCHKAGQLSEYIGGWSVACLVRNNKTQFDAWMKFMAKRPLTVAILDEWNPTAATPFANLAEDEIHLDIPDPDFKDSEAAVSQAGGSSTVENVANTADANSEPQAPPPPIEQPAEIKQEAGTITNVGSLVDSGLAKGNDVADKFASFQGILGKFGFANPDAKTSMGTILMTTFKLISAPIVMIAGMFYNYPQYAIPVAIVLVAAAVFLWDRSKSRVAKAKEGMPVELAEKIVNGVNK